jgi:hypothetical protein
VDANATTDAAATQPPVETAEGNVDMTLGLPDNMNSTTKAKAARDLGKKVTEGVKEAAKDEVENIILINS